jgi:acetylornithine deacetylase/succinyl-diaminopimelate desuccinylase-like protein
VRKSVEAAKEVYEKPPVITPLSAGSGPIYLFTNILRIPMTGAGVGYYGSRAHAPDENIRINDFINGVRHVAYTLINFSLD